MSLIQSLRALSGEGQTLISCCEAEAVQRLTGGAVLRMEKGRVL